MSHPIRTVGYTPLVAVRPDGSEILVSLFRDIHTGELESVTVAERPDKWATWSPPLEAVKR